MERIKLNVEKEFKKEILGNKLFKKIKVYPKNDEYMDLEDVEQVYEYLVNNKKINEKDILINGVLINGFIHMKGFNESGFDTERTSEYFKNRVLDVEKFTDDIQSLNVYIKVPN